MSKSALVIGFFLLLSPALALAATPACSAQGYTVVFVNGVFDTYQQALDNSTALNQKIGFQYNGQPLIVHLGYNQTHLAGAGDLVQSLAQLFNGSISNFDLTAILLQIYPEVTTRKLMLVGHSQGAFYTNSMYDYLLAHGEPNGSVAVYNVASPAAYTAGGGKYLNSSGDTLLALLRSMHFKVLPNNIDLVPTGQAGDYSGHAFTDDYLAGAAPHMLADMDGELDGLKATDASQTGDCFTPPTATLGYQTQAALFAVADPTAVALKAGTVATVQASQVALAAATKFAVGTLQLFADTVVITAQPPTDAQTTQGTEQIINKLYGSSLDNVSAQDKKELLGSSQGAAAALAVTAPKAAPEGVVLGTSTVTAAVAEQQPTTTSATSPNLFPVSANGIVTGGGQGGSVETAPIPAPAPASAPAPSNTVAEVVVPEAPTSTPATTTPPAEVPPAPIRPAGAPITDSFDTYSSGDDSAWSVWTTQNNTIVRFIADDGTADHYSADPTASDCRSGKCIMSATRMSGLGTFGYASVMYRESGVGQLSGAFTVWVRNRAGWRPAAANVGICAGERLGCQGDNAYMFQTIDRNDDKWHQYYAAWRQGAGAVETCFMMDDTAASDCHWSATTFSPGSMFDGVVLSGAGLRPDMGDQNWFDDLANAPAQ